ncbi:sugar ABC transporter permease [Rhodoferax lacus]|uniref:Sugar ABC transporter permease n=1 Tax=Rhodoferax lacus TaxID=2184758 RepID=A0A3E1RD71_9BURK|nr:carbohydrate ABC transporter permease [Rhodoferax lacus]RFO97316.1 sugar ABC transporter permease [Rhodoferax lacus]
MAPITIPDNQAPRKRTFSPGRAAAWVALGLMLLITVTPLWMVVKTALMHSTDLYTESDRLLPTAPTLDNFKRVLGLMTQEEGRARGGSGAEINFLRALGNSLVFTITIVLLQVSCAAMAAYAFARLRFPGRDTLFALFVGSMMVPGVVTFIPNFILIKDLGLLNTMVGMVAPFCLMQGFSVFFLRQFFLSIPRDLEEAALLDGASYFYIFIHVVLPLSITPLATIGMLTGINMWNEFFWPYLVAKDEMQQVLPVALQTFKSQTAQGQPDWTGLMAATAITVMPTILLLVVLGRRVVESVQFSGGK